MIVSANSGRSVLIRADEAGAWQATVRDCTGEIVRREAVQIGALCEIAVPAYGLIELTRA